jgi:hypothetical protein
MKSSRGCSSYSKRRAEQRSAFRLFLRSGIFGSCRTIAATGSLAGPSFSRSICWTGVGSAGEARRCAPRRHSAGANPRAVSCRCLGRAPRPHALPVELAGRRRRLPRPLARDQDRVRQVVADRRTAIGGDDQPRRTRYFVALLLGAHNPRPPRLRPPFRLHPFQSGQARSGRASSGLALLDVSPLRCQRNVSKRRGGRC